MAVDAISREQGCERRLFIRPGVGFGSEVWGFAFMSLMDDPEIIAQTEQWGDIKLAKELSQVARIRENIRAPWFPDFNVYYQPEIQKILIRQQSPRDGLARIAKRC